MFRNRKRWNRRILLSTKCSSFIVKFYIDLYFKFYFANHYYLYLPSFNFCFICNLNASRYKPLILLQKTISLHSEQFSTKLDNEWKSGWRCWAWMQVWEILIAWRQYPCAKLSWWKRRFKSPIWSYRPSDPLAS